MKKQLLSAMLAIVLLFSSAPLNAFAEEQYIDEPSVSTTDEENKPQDGENEKPAEENENPVEEELEKDENINPENSQEEVLKEEEQIIEPRALYAGEVEVSTVAELQDVVNGATEDTIITLADGFEFGAATLNVPDVNVIVDGGNRVWNSGRITVNGAGTGSLTIKNLKMDGTSNTKRMLENKATNGKLVLDKMEFYNSVNTGVIDAGAIDISTSGDATTEINNTHIYDNISGRGPAIYLGENSNVDINNSTIEKNSGNAGGWEAGAIASKNYRGILNINNTVFRENKNRAAYTGVFGGGGGAMSIHYLYGTINIDESVFDKNESNGEGLETVAKTYDGGAIYIIDGRDGAEFNVDKTTFSNNTAYDDGGAIMVQGTGNPGLTTNISNSTFYNNKAYGLDGANYSGGAIQFFKNGGTSKMTNSILSSTFVENQSGNEQSVIEQRGGAIGGSGSSLAATFTRNDSLFIGNQVYGQNGAVNTASNYKDVSNNTTTQAGGPNVINADKGATPQYTVDDVLGIKNIMLTENQSNIKAGVNSEIIKTIPIKPEGIADNTYTGTAAIPEKDQRGFVRYKDQGAVEISWVKYNSNGGVFNISELTSYDGKVYYEPNDEDKITDYYTVGNIKGEANVVDGKDTLKATLEGKEFKGWNTEADGSGETYAVGKYLTYADENIILYAVWGEKTPEPIEEYRVTYNGNTNDSGTAPVDTNNPYAKDSEVTVLSKGDLAKKDYTFKGWNTSAGDTFKITADTTLYAQWQKDSEDSGTGWTWSGSSSTTSKESPKTEETLAHMAYLNGYPDNTIRPQGSITRAEVAAIFARLKVGEANIPSAKANYSDVNASDWYAKYIAFVTDNKIMEGYEDGSFKPNDKITRAEFTAVVARYSSLVNVESSFEDVSVHWAEKYIGAVTSKGWINGYPDKTFKPEKDISREEVATMVNKMLDRKVDRDGLNNLSIKNFTDLDENSWSYFDVVEASNSHKYVRRTLGDIMENWKELIK
ncbi:Listeria/Bacterioides repeat-containing protein [Anaerosphaera aminiphila DSM 21120]|uniref:Listeria/Bacterioides repeat-containing protein n=1 Tax=Anaerosphaera aminiphila DSM 21120 TaxID=1120995 RepID=A0A1M5UGU0_9FIRM|nr:S-layer homology domain-containing protein [Anaerosphaera aminiphila]SHH61863.1 Listeria/Bacterioides repeat-containing protein [Anaerosphaera aminiphila DSM 21120]